MWWRSVVIIICCFILATIFYHKVSSFSIRPVKEDVGIALLLLVPVLVCTTAVSRTIRKTLSSIQFGICCMALIVLCIILATLTGMEVIFGSAWFNSLFVLLSFCILLAIIKRRKFDIKSPGFYAGHLGVIIILVGVFIKNVAGDEGVIHLWQGKETGYYINQDGNIGELGFGIRLERFIPEGYKSRLTVVDGARKIGKVVSVNNPFSYGGFTFYQFDYDPQNLRYSGLKVVKDPGILIIYIGFVVMLAGIVYLMIVAGFRNA